MFKNLAIFLLTFFVLKITFLAAKEDTSQQENISFKKSIFAVGENFYIGKIPHKPLWVVMERVTDDNAECWVEFSIKHGPKGTGRRAEMPNSGGRYFQNVLTQVSYIDNEMWVAYVTTDPCKKSFDQQKDDGQIQVYITVTSSPEAKITSHVGISKTVESFTAKQYPGIAMDLHAFAAKVMLMRNPGRRYMVAAPEVFIEMVFSKNVPSDKLFIGTKELLHGYKTDDRSTKGLHTLYELGKILKRERYKNPNVEDLDTILAKHPPIISVSYPEKPPFSVQAITIYKEPSSKEPWLSISRENPKCYKWMFEEAFLPIDSSTHYMAVDLRALAQCRPLDSLNTWGKNSISKN